MFGYYKFEYPNSAVLVIYSRASAEELWSKLQIECTAYYQHSENITEFLGKRSECEELPEPHMEF